MLNRKIHADKVMIWASNPEGTKVWCRRKHEQRWLLMQTPSWNPDNLYVVDNSIAIERMAKIEELEKSV